MFEFGGFTSTQNTQRRAIIIIHSMPLLTRRSIRAMWNTISQQPQMLGMRTWQQKLGKRSRTYDGATRSFSFILLGIVISKPFLVSPLKQCEPNAQVAKLSSHLEGILRSNITPRRGLQARSQARGERRGRASIDTYKESSRCDYLPAFFLEELHAGRQQSEIPIKQSEILAVAKLPAPLAWNLWCRP